VHLQLLDPGGPRPVQRSRIQDTVQHHGIHDAIEAQARGFVLPDLPGPLLASAHRTTEKELAFRRGHAVEIHGVGPPAGVDLNLAERDVIRETPIGHRLFPHFAQQHESRSPVAWAGGGPDSDASDNDDERSSKAEKELPHVCFSSDVLVTVWATRPPALEHEIH
jgi:hypothetical protein